MKNICRFFELLFLFLLISNLSIAQWVQTSGPGGGQISALGTDGTNYYASIYGHGIFISSDNGVSWKAINTGLSRLNVLAIAVKRTTAFAGTDSSGVFLSTNSGNNWVSRNNGLSDFCINVLTVKDTAIFIGTNHGVFISTDTCNTWVADTVGLSDKKVTAFMVKDSLFFAGTYANGIYRSTKNDNHWNPIGLNDNGTIITSLITNGTDIFAGTNGGVYKSIDNGNNWLKLATTSPNVIWATFAPLVIDGQRLFAASFADGGDRIWLSTDAGDNWSGLPNDGLGSINLTAFLVNNSTILAGSNGGLFISTNNANNWSAVEKGLPFSKVSSVVTNGSTIFAGVTGGSFSGGGISFSTDNGDTWIPCNSGLSDLEITAMSMVGSYIFAGASWNTYYSGNNGITWAQLNSPSSSGMNSIISKGSNFFGVGGGDVYISTNNGSDWTSISAGLPQYYNSKTKSHYHYSVSSLTAIDSILFAGTIGGGVYISTNNGSHWDTTNSRPACSSVYSLATRNSNIYAGAINGVFRSTNNGANWTSIGLTTVAINGLVIVGQNIFAATTGGIFLSSNDGGTWIEIDQGLINKNVNTLAIGGAYLYTGTMGSGVWRRPLSEVITEVENGIKQFPSRFVLEQNYPNPFNPSTSISFSLPSKSFVSLKVFDIMGREIATIVSEEMSSGSYTRQWNAANMSSGIYFYRLQSGSFIETKKLILLR
jgi:hypothetical protein